MNSRPKIFHLSAILPQGHISVSTMRITAHSFYFFYSSIKETYQRTLAKLSVNELKLKLVYFGLKASQNIA